MSKLYYNSIIYVIGADEGPVKVGLTENIEYRIKSLQTAYPYKLKLIFAMPGDQTTEKLLHSKLDRYRLHGEWFERRTELFQILLEWQYEMVCTLAGLKKNDVNLSVKIKSEDNLSRRSDYKADLSSLAYTVEDTCKILGIGPTKVWEMIGSGKIRSTKIGRRRLVIADSLKQLLCIDA